MTGQEYIGFQRNGKVVEHNVVREPRNLGDKCTSRFCLKAVDRFCNEFDESQRKEFFFKFQNSSWEVKKIYVLSLVITIEPKRHTTGCKIYSRRSNTFKYQLRYKDSAPKCVCKKMFLGTLGLKEFMVRNWVQQSEHGLLTNHSIIALNDNTIESKKQSPQIIAKRTLFANRVEDLKKWFISLAKMPSHYCRKRIKRLYLEGPFNSLNDVFEIYKQHCAENQTYLPFSKCCFSNFMKENNFSIFIPKNDQCYVCCAQISEQNSLIERILKSKDIFLPYNYVKTTMEARMYPNKLEAILLTHDYFFGF